MTAMWKANKHNDDVVRVECGNDSPGCSNLDADGDTIYPSTHYDTEAEARKSVLRDASIEVEFTGRDVMYARKALQEAEAKAGRAAERFARVQANIGRRKKPKPTPPPLSGGPDH